jgi:hypothetical protein
MISIHPEFLTDEWIKYRYIKEGGDDFINRYLIKFSTREDTDEFNNRLLIAPVPGFANAALIDVRNAIYQRMCDITRKGGSKSYQQTIAGMHGGIDLKGASMNNFIGSQVLTELLFMGKVGVYVDMPEIGDVTKKETEKLHPYAYIYTAEEIKNWDYEQDETGIHFTKLLLEETYTEYDDLGLPKTVARRYRYLYKEDGVVYVKYIDAKGQMIAEEGVVQLNIPEIPFVLFELDRSLLKDVANHQIALLNLESSDLSYALKSNFPFYVEQYSGKFQSSHLKTDPEDNEDDEIEVGNVTGRRYAVGMDQPAFIHPSAEPITASMEKQKQLKEDIRSLINLALSSIRPKFASAEAKQFDERGLESGLSFLGLVLELGEQQIAALYHMYENDNEITTVNYPETYGLKTNLQRMEEAERVHKLSSAVPSAKYQEEMSKEVVRILLSSKVSVDEMATMLTEIEETPYTTSDAEVIHGDVEQGLVSLETAAVARGYNSDEPKKAEADHAARLERIKAAQTSAVIPDENPNPAKSGKAEKEASQNPDLKE